MTRQLTIAEFAKLGDIGVSDWLQISQDLVNKFAGVSGDNQWIHTDVRRATNEAPFKGTIVPGYLILSLTPRLMEQMIRLTDLSMGINLGFNKVRFTNPMRVGDQLRLQAEMEDAKEAEGYLETVIKLTFEGRSYQKPICAAQLVKRWFRRV